MGLEDVLKRRALRLKDALSESGPKSSFMSIIYPATDHGKNMPPVVKTPSSIPSPNDSSSEEEVEDLPEKKTKEVDGPGTSKSPSFSTPVIGGQSSSVPPAHKRAAFELGYFGEARSERFISRCVELITGVSKVEQIQPGLATDGPSSVPPAPTLSTTSESARSKISDIVSKFKKDKPAGDHG